MQVLVPASRRKIARFNMARCEKENVNDGEENAQFKAMQCALVRCPGPGLCADPIMCAGTLFLSVTGEFRFATAWRARESEIKVTPKGPQSDPKGTPKATPKGYQTLTQSDPKGTP